IEPFGKFEELNIEREVVGLFISGHPLDDYKFEIDSFCNIELSQLNELEPLEGKDLRMAGIVSGFAHRTTKGGKPFGTLTIEDYNNNFTFFLFGDDYVKFKEYMMQGWFLFLQGRVVRQKWGDQRLEMKLHSIELLSELRDKKTKGIIVTMNADEVNSQVIEQIEKVCSQFKGDLSLRMNILDRENNIASELLSRKYTINPSNEMIEEMKKIPEVECKVLV
ncbi:MAG: DNA polymerase III subunit alpha, partial [Fulvivirga sp.]|uniref:OB-fold nucleic acid binding domain-containing protein n=1 Tax=Fulvivirga sp. TaxID=1931237 RepID=UPI0032EB07D9